MSQDALFYESFNDALDAVVKSCGGAKVVASKLWPEKTPDAAHRLLLACLNEGRVEKLSPEQTLFLLKLGRDRGCHAAMNFLARDCGYADPTPIEPEDERARLQREFIEAQKAMQVLAGRMEQFGLIRAVA
ncbi:hypothetical protein [Ralstonia holmesii]|uniref:hypothetical protein n=1 Tax=Ralstonia holmesii TaxID=3058602 RepID=UPI0028F5A513|nr:hypothetical protein [Ralstonia sp. LMG 32967]CAJ0698698.1 hypothetical protein R11007_02863 [Ralstonia sp. LMG 32967]